MKRSKPTFAALAALFACLLLRAPSSGGIDTPVPGNPDLSVFTSEKFGFSISVPRKWRKSEFNLYYKHVINMAGPRGARVRVTAVVNDDQEKEKWANWKDWFAPEPGGRVKSIIESRVMDYGASGTGVLYVFESYGNRRRSLVRLLLITLEKTLIAVECSAPMGEFYKNAALFDKVMVSLKINQAGAGK